MLFYSIAHYYDVGNTTHYRYGKSRIKNKYKNIESHINAFKKVENKNKAFVLTSSINDKRGDTKYDEVKKDLYTFCKNLLPDNKVAQKNKIKVKKARVNGPLLFNLGKKAGIKNKINNENLCK